MTKSDFAVFNLMDMPFAFFGAGENMLQIPARQWRVLPKDLVLKLSDNPNLFIDFGAGAFTDNLLPYKNSHTDTIGFAGVLDSITGYGNATHPIVMDLHKRSNINLLLGKTGYWNQQYLPEEVKVLMKQAESEPDNAIPQWGEWSFRNPLPEAHVPRPMQSRWSIALTIPPELCKVQSPRKLLYTMCEGDAIPQGSGDGKDWQDDRNDWVTPTNVYADVLAVPSAEMKSVFEKSVKREAHVVPLGTSFDVFKYEPRTAERLPLFAGEGTPRREKRDIFTIVIDGHLAPRKAPTLSLLNVVYPVLQDKEDWRLVIKCRAGEKGMLSSIKDDRVYVVAADFTPEQMNDLYHSADCGLCLSLYEGWGMTFREMMASGLPVIVSQTSGHKEDCDPDYNYVVPISDKEQINDYYNLTAYRDLPDWEAAQRALETEYQAWHARGGVQSAMGERAAAWVRERRPWSRTTDLLLGLVSEADEYFMQRKGRRP